MIFVELALYVFIGYVLLLWITGRCIFKHRWFHYGTTDHMAYDMKNHRFISWKREHLRCSNCGAKKRGRKINKYK